MPRSELVQSVIRALDVMEVLAGSGEGLTPREVAVELRLNRSTVHNLMRTLASKRFVRPAEDRGRYVLGPAVAAMLELQGQRSILSRAVSTLKELQRDLPSCGVSFTQPVDGVMHSMARIESSRPDLVQRPHVEIMHPYAKASSLALQAFANKGTVADLRHRYPFNQYGSQYWDSLDDLESFLELSRERGYVLPPPLAPDLFAVTAPIFDPLNRFAGAIGAYRVMSPGDFDAEALAGAVVDAAEALEAALRRATPRT
jgi:DNA-binding IclR family transcriptional regulator